MMRNTSRQYRRLDARSDRSHGVQTAMSTRDAFHGREVTDARERRCSERQSRSASGSRDVLLREARRVHEDDAAVHGTHRHAHDPGESAEAARYGRQVSRPRITEASARRCAKRSARWLRKSSSSTRKPQRKE